MNYLLMTRFRVDKVREFKQKMTKFFDMTNIGLLSTYLGILMAQTDCKILLNQSAFHEEYSKNRKQWIVTQSYTPIEKKLLYIRA